MARNVVNTLLLLCLPGLTLAASTQGYFRYPALHGEQLVFTAEGDLWLAQLGDVTRQSDAFRLTKHATEESYPAFSPDGKQLAFVAAYDGASDVYLMPLAGGAPKRLSFDSGRVWVQGFSADGAVLYTTENVVGPSWSRVLRLVHPDTLSRSELPLADANQAWLEPDGTLWFTRFGLQVTGDFSRDYRGGAVSQLWRWDSKQSAEATRMGDAGQNLQRPMRWRDRLLVVSDQDGSTNLWSISLDGNDAKKLTTHGEFEVRNPALSGDRVVYQYGADLRLLDLDSGRDNRINLALRSDFEASRERYLQKPLNFTTGVTLAPNGSRVALSARGHAVLVGKTPQRRTVISAPEGARLRDAQLAPDGSTVYALMDHASSSQIWRFPSSGGTGAALSLQAGNQQASSKQAISRPASNGQASNRPAGNQETATQQAGIHRWRMHASPDGRWLAVEDKAARLMLVDTRNGSERELDRVEGAGDDPRTSVVWSHDSKYLALAQPATRARRTQIVLIRVDDKQRAVLSTDRYESFDPAFSRDGQWLYFLSNRQFTPTPSSPWGDRNAGPHFDKRARIYALALQPNASFPFQAVDELRVGPLPPDPKIPAAAAAALALPEIVFDGLAERLFEVPLAAGNYRALSADRERLYLLDTDRAADGRGAAETLALRTLPFSNHAPLPETFAAGLTDYALSADGKTILLVKPGADPSTPQAPGELLLVDVGAKAPDDLTKSQVRISGWTLPLEPRAEWRQLFADAWRLHQQFSFDPKMRQLDWSAVRRRYEPLVERVTDRAELDDVLSQMSAELGILHSQVRGAELPTDPEPAPGASLGAIFSASSAGVRIAKIYRSDPELPSERGPLLQPGVDAREGDLLLAINGQPVRSPGDVTQALRAQAGAQVLLELSRQDNTQQTKTQQTRTHQTVVVPIALERDAQLRYGEWVLGRQEAVQSSSDGRIGYLHLRAMTGPDMGYFAREFYANVQRDGLIIDVRRNRGGNIDSWIIDHLLRRTWAFWQPPLSEPYWNMQQSFRGHLVVLADELTYSDGETFSAGVKALKLGPVIGMRTAGAGIWLSDRNRLADNGAARVAEFGQFDAQGRWLIEGRGVAPDIEVENLPFATAQGQDAQLQAALDYLKQKLAREPILQPPAQSIPPRGTPGHDGG